jgi:hypothetical protein
MSHRLPLFQQSGVFLLTLLVTAAAVLVALRQVGLPLLGIDDAHIFLVYGKNLTSGAGLVYNQGGERVEGFSSLLWLLVIALGYLAFPSPEKYLLIVSVLLVSGAIAMLALRIDGRKAFSPAGLVLIAWVVSSPAYVTWVSLPLMDTALWSALVVLGAVFALVGPPFGLAIIASLMVLARPEGMLWAPVLIVIATLPLWVEKGPWAALRAYWPAALAYLLTLAALTAWRLLYFGYPLPNTYYVKMSPDIPYNLGQGLTYLLAFLYMNPVVLLGLIPAIVALLINGRWFLSAIVRPGSASGADPRLRYVAISLIVLLALLVPVYMGGDHFGNFRFYQPAWPLLILPALALLQVLKIQAPRPLGYLAALFVILAIFLLPRTNWFNQAYRSSLIHEITLARQGQAVARTMNQLFAGEFPSVGVVRAGAVALEYDGEVIDLMGLNNTTMAHAPGDRKGVKNHAAFNSEVFFAQRPQIMLPAKIQGSTAKAIQEKLAWDNAVLKGLLLDPRFTAQYQLVEISDGRTGILAYADLDRLSHLIARGLEVEFMTDVTLQDQQGS